MSTRSTTHFTYGKDVEAIVYRHSDGYPNGHGKDLLAFFIEVAESTQDTRFGDPSYLAAKLVVWLAKQYARHYDYDGTGKGSWVDSNYLDFLSVGVVQSDPGDIDYRYIVDSSQMVNGRPKVTIQNRYGDPVSAGPEDAAVIGELAGDKVPA